MELSECCSYPVVFTDICSYCLEHCEIYEDNDDDR